MSDIKDLSFDEIVKKMNRIKEIEVEWNTNKNPSQLRREISALNISELDYLASEVADPKALAIIVGLYFHKLFSELNMKLKDMIMSYRNDPSKLMEMQAQIQKLLNLDGGRFNFEDFFSNSFGFDEKDETQEKPEKDSTTQNNPNKKLN